MKGGEGEKWEVEKWWEWGLVRNGEGESEENEVGESERWWEWEVRDGEGKKGWEMVRVKIERVRSGEGESEKNEVGESERWWEWWGWKVRGDEIVKVRGCKKWWGWEFVKSGESEWRWEMVRVRIVKREKWWGGEMLRMVRGRNEEGEKIEKGLKIEGMKWRGREEVRNDESVK